MNRPREEIESLLARIERAGRANPAGESAPS